MNSTEDSIQEMSPGRRLAELRQREGYTVDYVAAKLHVRSHIIEYLEADRYERLPEPVFVKGYIRAYAKLLSTPSEPLLAIYNSLAVADRKVEKALWQGKRETQRKKYFIRFGGLAALVGMVLTTAYLWHNQNNPESAIKAADETQKVKQEPPQDLTSVSKMQSLFVQGKGD